MIKEIRFVQYKKLKDISIGFEAGLNAISGENGTCKSSLLYLISNSFQSVTQACDWVTDPSALEIVKTVNAVTNPKIESLQRECMSEGDGEYKDPAQGVKGTLYSVYYYDNKSLEFRRHNSRVKDKSRFSLKPKYLEGSSESLPYCPVVYLGLPRLVPYGEFLNENAVSPVKKNLPDSFKEEVAKNFKEFTGYETSQKAMQKIEGIKRRTEFTTSTEGVDSNTISAGEDNLYIILAAMESLKNYYQSINSRNDIESILLVDELDATLHPDYQIRILELMRKYSAEYKIQIVFTTHSLTMLEDMLLHKDKVTYLVNNIDYVTPMEEPTIEQIKAHLYNKTYEDIYQDKCIPVFTEDAEARFILEIMVRYYEETKPVFRDVKRFFSIPDINIGADILRGLFKDEKLIRSRVGAFCVLDGDKGEDKTNYIICLPGRNQGSARGQSPEEMLFEYAKHLYDSNDAFWSDREIIRAGFSKSYFQRNILSKIEKFTAEEGSGETKKKKREFNKNLFNNHLTFFEYVFKRWLHDPVNADNIEKFYENLKIMFKKCAEIRGISASEWN